MQQQPGTPARKRSARGARTRARLLEVAGQVFAQQGFDAATGQSICRRAGVHTAAIVYHFGGMSGLYAAVLAEARERLLSTAALAAAVQAQRQPRRKLAAFLGLIVQALTGPMSRSWAGRLFGRELVSPSTVCGPAHDRVLAARARILESIVSALTGLPEQHELVARGCIAIMAPCALLLLVDRHKLQRLLPGLSVEPTDAAMLTRYLLDFSLGGLAAVTGAERRRRTRRSAARLSRPGTAVGARAAVEPSARVAARAPQGYASSSSG